MTITEQEFERRKAVEKAYYVDGKDIEYRYASREEDDEWDEMNGKDLNLDWFICDYRINEQPSDKLDIMIGKYLENDFLDDMADVLNEISKQLKELREKQ